MNVLDKRAGIVTGLFRDLFECSGSDSAVIRLAYWEHLMESMVQPC